MAATDPKSEQSGEESRRSDDESGPSAADLIASEDFQAKLEAARRKRAEVMARKEGGGRLRPAEPAGTDRPSDQRPPGAGSPGKRGGRPVLRAPAAAAGSAPGPARTPARRRFSGSTVLAMLLSFAAGGALVVVLSARDGGPGPAPDTASVPPAEGGAVSPEPSPPAPSAGSNSLEVEGPPPPPDVPSKPPPPDIAVASTAPPAPEAVRVGAPPDVVPTVEMPAAERPIDAPGADPVDIVPPSLGPPPAPSLAVLPPIPVRLLGRDPGRVARVSEALRSAGVAEVAGREVAFVPGQSVVRFYTADARALAERLAQRLGGQLQDLTSYSAPPAEAGVEVWLAGD